MALAVIAGCADSAASGTPSAVIVTVTSTVPPAPAISRTGASVDATRSGGSSPQPKPADQQPAETSASPEPSFTTNPPATTSRAATPSRAAIPSKPITSAPGTTKNAKTGTPPGSLSTGDLIAAATSAAAAAGVNPADPDAPGPDTGPPCKANPKYVNEATTGLRSDVATGWKAAVVAAKKKGITLCLNDGKRSRAQQQAQFDQYATEYGKEVAEQLVLPPEKSAHVVGVAVDVQPAAGYRWLQATKGSLGFCRIYDNEAWHFEYNPAYRSEGCPARLPEPER